jgi:hypothetical protein
MGEIRKTCCNILNGKPEGKKPLERPRRRREYNTKMEIREIVREVVD